VRTVRLARNFPNSDMWLSFVMVYRWRRMNEAVPSAYNVTLSQTASSVKQM
jgi:hypothetical protein